MRPYVVSCDLATLWQEFGFDVSTDTLEEFRARARNALQQSVGSTEWIPEDELRSGLSALLSASSFPIVSLDQTYTRQETQVDLTRLVNTDLCDIGYGTRDGGFTDPATAIHKAVGSIKEREIALVDDVIFSGAMMEHVILLLTQHGIRVRHVFAGVAIGEGVERVRTLGCPVAAVRTYPEVHDEICERDFLPGAPYSGRTLAAVENTGAPYVLPFGNPAAWASIPSAHQAAFSKEMLEAAAAFYKSTGIVSPPRNVAGLKQKAGQTFSDALLQAEMAVRQG
jgi:hypothetical protein